MGTSRKTRYGAQSDGERERLKEEHKQRKEDQKQMEK